MSLRAEISVLLERAAPLRLLPDDEAERAGLGAIVDEINSLRKIEADAEREAFMADIKASLTAPAEVEGADASEAPKRKPGRPKKAD